MTLASDFFEPTHTKEFEPDAHEGWSLKCTPDQPVHHPYPHPFSCGSDSLHILFDLDLPFLAISIRVKRNRTGYVPNPVLVIIDVQPKEMGIPTKAYYAAEEVKENAAQKSQKVSVHVPSEIAAHEVEEIGMPHGIRKLK